jgi:hypothetical protein
MSTTRVERDEADASRRKIFIAVGAVGLLLVAALIYWATRPRAAAIEPRLENAVRAGSPEFAQLKERVVVDFVPDEDAFESTRAAGDIVMTMRPKVRNFSGRTISGLELKSTVVDLGGQPVRERTAVVIPGQAAELEPNKVLTAQIMMEGFKPTDVRANIRIEVTGVRLK